MVEFTRLEVSKQLAALGFKKEKEGFPCDAIYMGKYAWRLDTSFVEQYANVKLAEYPAYRADTLLAWLLKRGWDIDVGQLHKLNDKIVIDAVLAGTNTRLATEGLTLPDALADIVFAILAPPPKEK